jgi:hypothetical protein
MRAAGMLGAWSKTQIHFSLTARGQDAALGGEGFDGVEVEGGDPGVGEPGRTPHLASSSSNAVGCSTV